MNPLFIGYAEDGQRLEFGPDALQTHVHGVGASRTGKSKLIEWIARDLIRQAQGFCLIDPHGFLYEDLLRWLAYLQPNRDIILLNPSSTGHVVGFNPFRRGEGELSVQVERRLQATIKVWGQANTDETPLLERGLKCFYHYLLEQEQPIQVASYLLRWSHRRMWAQLAGTIRDQLIREQWQELHSLPRVTEFWDKTSSTWNKLFRFLSSDTLRRVMGLPTNNIDLKEIIENGKILLVNLQPSDWLTEQQGRFIGTLLLNEVWEVVRRRRQTESGGAPTPFFLIIDEFQNFLTPDVPKMLNESAKYGLHLFLFHQHLEQLRQDDALVFASMQNARTKLVFGGLSRDDARLVAENIFPGQIDLKRVKFLVEQTKFWPVYTREKVYSCSSGQSSAMTLSSGQAWDPAAQEWIPSTSQTEADGLSFQEGMADIPFLYPVPFKEVSSITPYSLEESLWELSDRLMEQYQRHFMIRLPGKPTLAAVTPFVKNWYVRPEILQSYTEELMAGFLPAAEVDRALLKIEENLTQALKYKGARAEPAIAWRRSR